MTAWNGFGRSLGFAAVAGAGTSLLLVLVPPTQAGYVLLRAYLVGCAVVYAAGLATRSRDALVAAAAGATLGVLLLLLPVGLAGTALGGTAILAWLRSGILYRARPLRALTCELLLGLTGLALAGFLKGAGVPVMGLGLAVWGYFLVQSVFFLIGGVTPRPVDGPLDPFDRARADLLALLR